MFLGITFNSYPLISISALSFFFILNINGSSSTSLIFKLKLNTESSNIDSGANAVIPGIGFIKVKLVSMLLDPSDVVSLIGVEPI